MKYFIIDEDVRSILKEALKHNRAETLKEISRLPREPKHIKRYIINHALGYFTYSQETEFPLHYYLGKHELNKNTEEAKRKLLTLIAVAENMLTIHGKQKIEVLP